MIYLILLFLEIIFLFFLSRMISKILSRFLSIHALSLLFLPGVIVHELSHWLVAAILFVKVGEIEFGPKIEDRGLKLGSAMVAKTDPVRRAIIGFAPVFVGILLILGIVYFISHNLALFQTNQAYIAILSALGIFYILFAITNTMFSSKADMEGSLELLIAVLVIFSALYFVGFRFPLSFTKILLSDEVVHLVQKSSIFLLAPIIIDLFILGTIKIIYFKKII